MALDLSRVCYADRIIHYRKAVNSRQQASKYGLHTLLGPAANNS
jgi:hypothetical protein